MANPSSGSPPSPAVVERGAGVAERAEVAIIAGPGDPLAAAYAAFLGQEPARSTDEDGPGPPSLVLFLPDRLDGDARRAITERWMAAARRPLRFVGVVGTFRVHLGDPAAEETERFAIDLVRSAGIAGRLAVFRPGYVLGTDSGLGRWLSRLSPFAPLAPDRLRSCFVDADELFAAIEAERSADSETDDEPGAGRRPDHRRREFTILGANRPWREILARHRGRSTIDRAMTATAHALSWLGLGHLIAFALAILARWSSRVRSWSVHTLRPRTIRELLSLCHRRNIGHVRVVGYNNGVNHFGHRHPGKTIVSTVLCRRITPAGPGRLKADCGATIRDAREFLAGRGEELHVMPNYSYVALGTSFFVPIHGSAVEYATVADTIVRAVLYDPDSDRIIPADREDDEFREHIYNPRSRAVVLRLHLRSRPRSRYFVRREIRRNPGVAEILDALRDRDAANVEIRQGHAASDTVTISRYFTEPGGPSGPALELPRDRLGRLWDQLEENPVTSFLMHALSRHVAWHTELFLTPAEFERFWATHAEVPLRKIQLRYIRRDGMPHSPFRDEDCVSADLFLFRPDKPAFDAYLGRTLPSVRTNPGKHSN